MLTSLVHNRTHSSINVLKRHNIVINSIYDMRQSIGHNLYDREDNSGRLSSGTLLPKKRRNEEIDLIRDGSWECLPNPALWHLVYLLECQANKFVKPPNTDGNAYNIQRG